MISYVTIGVNDLSSARIFYDAVLGSLGHVRVYERPGWLGYTDAIGNYMPRIWVCNPIDEKPATVGNGSMVGLHAKSPEEVDRFHAAGLAHGGSQRGRSGPARGRIPAGLLPGLPPGPRWQQAVGFVQHGTHQARRHLRSPTDIPEKIAVINGAPRRVRAPPPRCTHTTGICRASYSIIPRSNATSITRLTRAPREES